MREKTKVTISMMHRAGGLWTPGEPGPRYYDVEVVDWRWPTGYQFAEATVLDVVSQLWRHLGVMELGLHKRNLIRKACQEARETGRAEFEI
jgi:hypothetical protein